MEDPTGFAIRYVWTAQADGPALQSGIKSREYITPYRPIIISTPGNKKEPRKRGRKGGGIGFIRLISAKQTDTIPCYIDKEWTYRKTLMKDKKHAIAEVQAKLYKQSYCPGNYMG